MEAYQKRFPDRVNLYEKYVDVLIAAGVSKTLRNNNLKALLSLGRIAKKKEIDWNSITRDQVNVIQTYIMETWHTAGHKKFLMQFVRWLKTGKRNHSKRIADEEEIFDIEIRKVAQRITREDLLTDEE